MFTATTMVRQLPARTLSAAGRAFLEEILAHSSGWRVAIEQIGGEWFLVDASAEESVALTPIEVFNLEDGTLF